MASRRKSRQKLNHKEAATQTDVMDEYDPEVLSYVNKVLDESQTEDIDVEKIYEIFMLKKTGALYKRDCPICLEPRLFEEKNLRVLHCGHFFHIHCIKLWSQPGTCPVCRRPFYWSNHM